MITTWRAVTLVAAAAACSGHASVEDASRRRDAPAMTLDTAVTAVTIDAAPPVDASTLPLLACSRSLSPRMGRVSISVDPTTLRGELLAFDTSKAPMRQIRVHAEPTATQTVFVFDGYAPRDSTFKGRPVRRSERLQPGAVIARIVQAGTEHRLVFDGKLRLDSDFDQGKWLDGYPCP